MYHCVRAKDLIMREIIVLMRDTIFLRIFETIEIYKFQICTYTRVYIHCTERDKINDDNVNTSKF